MIRQKETKANRFEGTLNNDKVSFQQIFTFSNDAIFVIDPKEDKILDVNPKACRMLGYSYEELLSLPISSIHPHEILRFLAFSESVLTIGRGWTNELSCLCKTGQVLPSEISASVININGRRCILAIVRDITQRKKKEEELKHLTIIDPLTNIYNYRHFQKSLDHEFNRLKRYSGPLCLLMIDVDDFKSYNDTYGHLEGDMLLKEVSKVLSKTLRKADIVCRYAGDEFVVIMPESQAFKAEIVAEKIMKEVENLSLKRTVTLSIGIGEYTSNMNQHDLIRNADTALYRAKKESKNIVRV